MQSFSTLLDLQDSWVSSTGYKKSTLLSKLVTKDTTYECTFVINSKDYKMNVDADVVGKSNLIFLFVVDLLQLDHN